MNFILLTQYDGKIVGPFAKLLGILMNGIYDAISSMGIPNIGLAIILFTIIVNILLIPLTIMQQKNMKLNAVVNPELQKIQSKYKGKRDQASMEKQQKETQMIYDKYGYNPTSGCLPTLVQFPIMLALYRVIYQIPGYVTGIKEQLQEIATIALTQNDFASKIADLANANAMNPEKYAFDGATPESVNYIIDLFYKFDKTEWASFSDLFPSIADQIRPLYENILDMNSFLGGINLTEAPGFKLSIALLIPFLAWFTQWLNIKVSQAGQNTNTNPDDPTAATMKSMNTFMPLMSAFFCITFPAGLGIYWIASAVVRTVIQVCVNKYFDMIGVDSIIEKNIEKQNKKRAKQGLPEINADGSYVHGNSNMNSAVNTEKRERIIPVIEKNTSDSSAYYNKTYDKGSIAARARMVQDFNDKEKK